MMKEIPRNSLIYLPGGTARRGEMENLVVTKMVLREIVPAKGTFKIPRTTKTKRTPQDGRKKETKLSLKEFQRRS